MKYEGPDHTLKVYLNDIAQTPLLTIEEENILAERIRNGDESAREQMIKANLRLVVKIAKEYSHYGVPLLDLISEGNIGLMKAVEKFDPNRGAKLSTYGVWWIKQSIKRALANQSKTIRLPVHMVEKVAKMRRLIVQLTEEFGREPTDEEISGVTGIPENKVRMIRDVGHQPRSLDAPMSEGESGTYGDMISDEHAENPANMLSHKNMKGELIGLLDILKPRERAIIEKRFALNGYQKEFTLEEVGAEFGVTRERIRQLQNIAIGKMQRALRRKEKKYQVASPTLKNQSSTRIANIISILCSEPTYSDVINILENFQMSKANKEQKLGQIPAGENTNWYSLCLEAIREIRKTQKGKNSLRKITYSDVETFLRATVFSLENSIINTRKRR